MNHIFKKKVAVFIKILNFAKPKKSVCSFGPIAQLVRAPDS